MSADQGVGRRPPRLPNLVPNLSWLKAHDVGWLEALMTCCDATLVIQPADDSMYRFALSVFGGAAAFSFGKDGEIDFGKYAIAALRGAAREQLIYFYAQSVSTNLCTQCAKGTIPLYWNGRDDKNYAPKTEAAVALIEMVAASPQPELNKEGSGAVKLTESELAVLCDVVVALASRERAAVTRDQKRDAIDNLKREGATCKKRSTASPNNTTAETGTPSQQSNVPLASAKNGRDRCERGPGAQAKGPDRAEPRGRAPHTGHGKRPSYRGGRGRVRRPSLRHGKSRRGRCGFRVSCIFKEPISESFMSYVARIAREEEETRRREATRAFEEAARKRIAREVEETRRREATRAFEEAARKRAKKAAASYAELPAEPVGPLTKFEEWSATASKTLSAEVGELTPYAIYDGGDAGANDCSLQSVSALLIWMLAKQQSAGLGALLAALGALSKDDDCVRPLALLHFVSTELAGLVGTPNPLDSLATNKPLMDAMRSLVSAVCLFDSTEVPLAHPMHVPRAELRRVAERDARVPVAVIGKFVAALGLRASIFVETDSACVRHDVGHLGAPFVGGLVARQGHMVAVLCEGSAGHEPPQPSPQVAITFDLSRGIAILPDGSRIATPPACAPPPAASTVDLAARPSLFQASRSVGSLPPLPDCLRQITASSSTDRRCFRATATAAPSVRTSAAR